MKEFKENDIISLKLVSGEEVIGKFKSKTSDTTTIEKALVMMHGPQGLAFGTFFATANSDKGIDILNDKYFVVSLSPCNFVKHRKVLTKYRLKLIKFFYY